MNVHIIKKGKRVVTHQKAYEEETRSLKHLLQSTTNGKYGNPRCHLTDCRAYDRDVLIHHNRSANQDNVTIKECVGTLMVEI